MLLIRNPLSWVWLLLVITTLVSWWLGAASNVVGDGTEFQSLNFLLTTGIVLIAIIKMRFVIWYFMEVRHGPSWLRWTCDSWLVFVAITVLALYRGPL